MENQTAMQIIMYMDIIAVCNGENIGHNLNVQWKD